MDGIGSIFLGMNILGRGVGTYAFHSMGHFSFESYGRIAEIYEFVCRGISVETWPCTSQFLKLGPEISTRDLNQAKKKVKVRCQKKKKTMHFSPPQAPAEILSQPQDIFFFFSCIRV